MYGSYKDLKETHNSYTALQVKL